jgi:transketolase
VHGWFTDDTPKRFAAYGWHVVPNVDGHDAEAVQRAIVAAKAETGRPSLICCKTIIGWGAPNKQGTEATHGAALGEAEVAATRQHIDWPYEPSSCLTPSGGWERGSGARRNRSATAWPIARRIRTAAELDRYRRRRCSLPRPFHFLGEAQRSPARPRSRP